MAISSSASRFSHFYSEFKRILNAHHLTNICLALSFVVLKSFEPLCRLVFPSNVQCGFDRREHEVIGFLGVIVFWKNRKATNWLHYLANLFLFARLANSGLFFRADPLLGVIYGVLCLVAAVIFPEPAYDGPERITYFRPGALQDELSRNKRCTWIIEFYASWSPECHRISSVFAQLSQKFTLPNLRFGKLDVGKCALDAEKFRINAHPTSRQLPTIALFKEGKETRRKPLVGAGGRAVPFVFSEENCILDFDLNNLYNECKQNLTKAEKQSMENGEAEVSGKVKTS